MLPKQAISAEQLRKEGSDNRKISSMASGLKLFPTPFKGIYYVPMPQERDGNFIENPMRALTLALTIYLKNSDFYYSCRTAEERAGARWQPSGEIHVVNAERSGKIRLDDRIATNRRKHTYRSRKIADLLSFYGKRIIFHKISSLARSKTKKTPYGTFAIRLQAKKDTKRFREK